MPVKTRRYSLTHEFSLASGWGLETSRVFFLSPVATKPNPTKHQLNAQSTDAWGLGEHPVFFSAQVSSFTCESILFFRVKFLVSQVSRFTETRNLSRKNRMLSQATKYQVFSGAYQMMGSWFSGKIHFKHKKKQIKP